MKKLIREIHQRSIWQVLGIYLAASWVALQVVAQLVESVGLPSWVEPFAVVLLVIGLPIVVATAFVQEGGAARAKQGDGDPEADGSAAPPTAAHGTGSRPAAPRIRRSVFTWRNAGIGAAAAALLWAGVAVGWLVFGGGTREAAAVDLRSIAVLPFTTRATAGDEEAGIFADGMHDDLLTQLTKIDSLTVISRTSVMRYRDTDLGIPEIASQLGVATVLEGGVQRSGDRVRVNVQLIDARRDTHLWAHTYDEVLTAENIFAIQTDLAKRIAGALQTTLSPELAERLEVQPTGSLEAYDLYVRGRHYWNQRSEDGVRTAIEYFRKAIAVDSTYALAWAGLADSWTIMISWGYAPESEALPRAREAAERALALDPDLAEAHTALGGILDTEYRDEEARRHFERAIELNPGYATAHQWYGDFLRTRGRHEEALQRYRRAQELDPLSPIINIMLAEEFLATWRFDSALVRLQATIDLDPDDSIFVGRALADRSFVLLSRGQDEEAVRLLRRAADMQTFANLGLAWALYDARQFDEVIQTASTIIEHAPPQIAMQARTALVAAYTELGRFEEARAEIARLEPSTAEDSLNRSLTRALLEARAGNEAASRRALEEVRAYEGTPAWNAMLGLVAAAHGLLGDTDRAFALLDDALAARSPSLVTATVDPIFDPLRSDPRFDAIVEAVRKGR